MAYCFECGEQVAENDIFCPYCGISIQPAAVADAVDDVDPFDKTIVVSPPAALPSDAPAQVAPFAKADETLSEEKLLTEDSEVLNDKTEDFSLDSTSENLDVKTPTVENYNSLAANQPAEYIFSKDVDNIGSQIDQKTESFQNFDEIQAERQNVELAPEKSDVSAEIPETLKPTEELLAERFSTEFNNKNVAIKPLDANPPADASVKFDFKLKSDETDDEINKQINNDFADESAAPSISQTESSLMSYEEAEVKEILSAETPEKSVDDDAPNAADETLPENPISIQNDAGDSKSFDAGQDVAAIVNPVSVNEEIIEADSAVQSEFAPLIETPNAVAAPIAMPEVELPAADNCPPSRFDSVSIMEKKEEVRAEPAAVVFSDLSPETPEIIGTPEDSKKIGSFTAPISANSDTGGKNKTKLKPLDEGTVLNGRYEVIRKIGGGGMGAVYLASDKNLGGVLRAVKEMVQSYIEDEQQEKAVSDFKRESLLLTSLDHQSIPTIYDYFFDETEARFYLVMKYISGGDLSGRLRSAPESRIDEASVTNWAIQIADVLDYLHNRQPPIVYRDLKPANIMVDGNSGRVMLIDFGIARWVNKEEKGVTAVGTMGYAPPELFSGNVEARSDIYSLGSTMFHLLTGADPQSNPLLIFDFQKHPRPRQINPQLSDQMERILMRAVEYNADKRFASAAELKKTLEEHQENLKSGTATFGIKAAPVSIALSDQPVFCGFCGQKIVATDMFCAFCGSKQPLAQQGVHSQSEGYSPVALTAQLLIVGTSDLEQPAFRLEKEDNLVGRRDPMSNIFPEVDLSKFDPQTKISRRHARIWREGNGFLVEDLGSSNGTYILPVVSDTKRLHPHQPQPLTSGDKIRLGDTTMHFILG